MLGGFQTFFGHGTALLRHFWFFFVNFEGPVPHIFLFSAVFGQKGVFFQANKIRQSILTVFPVVWNTFGVWEHRFGPFRSFYGFFRRFFGEKWPPIEMNKNVFQARCRQRKRVREDLKIRVTPGKETNPTKDHWYWMTRTHGERKKQVHYLEHL